MNAPFEHDKRQCLLSRHSSSVDMGCLLPF